MSSHISRRRIRRAAMSALCGAAILAGSAGPAFAQADGPGVPDVSAAATLNAAKVSLIDPAAPASLTIHKYLGDPTGNPANGTDQTINLPGYEAKFKIYKINNLDPTKIADWEAYTKLDPSKVDTANPGANFATPIEVTTTGGSVKVDVPQGFYFIAEVPLDASSNVTRTNIAPFFAAVPMTDQAAGVNDTQWRYDVHVHPKNQELGITKTVVDKGMQIGDNVNYTIVGDVPAPSTDKTKMLNQYRIVDIFDNKELELVGDPVVSLISKTAAEVSLTKDTDYVVTAVTVDANDANKSWFEVQFTKSGLKKLTEAREADATIQVQMKQESKLLALTDGDEVNTVRLIPPTSSVITREDGTDVPPPPTDDVPPPPESTVVSKHGAIVVNKLNGNDNNIKLEGAEFELYRCNPGTTDLQADAKVTVNGVSKWTTNADGTFTIDGVQLEDWNNGAAVEDVFDYCLIETKAPAGFELNPKPISVSVTTDDPKATDGAYTQVADVLNYPNNGGFRLPETGAMGVAGLILAGVTVAGGSVIAGRRNKNDKAEEKAVLG